jgi:hypothetical protein
MAQNPAYFNYFIDFVDEIDELCDATRAAGSWGRTMLC